MCVHLGCLRSQKKGGGSGDQAHLQEEMVRGGAPQTRLYIRPSQSEYALLLGRETVFPPGPQCWDNYFFRAR